MILVPEDDTSKKGDPNSNLPQVNVVSTEDPPPLYSPSGPQSASSSTQPVSRYVPDIKPSNFVYLSRPNSNVKGDWVIDPSLSIPSTLLPPLASGKTEETRKNILLESRNGWIDGDIYILSSNGDSSSAVKGRQRISIRASSQNGSVTTKIHDAIGPRNPGDTRLPIQIFCQSFNGYIKIYLPRSFEGTLNLETHHGSLRFSDAVKQLLTPFSELNGVQRSFLGRFDASKWENGAEWVGDELSAETRNGDIKIYFDDEMDAPGKPKSQGFFGRIFRF